MATATRQRKKPGRKAAAKRTAQTLPALAVVSDFEAQMALAAGPVAINRERFCQAFVRTGSVLDAIREVAPQIRDKREATKLARSYAQDPDVAARIRVIAADIMAQEQATTAVVWGNTMRMATTCISELVRDDWTLRPVNEIAPSARTAIKKLKIEERFEAGIGEDAEPTRIVTTTLEIHDRLAATRLLAGLKKMLGTDPKDPKDSLKDAIREMQAEFEQGQKRVEEARRQRIEAQPS